ncbi:MAG: LUD domain-containing protein [Thermoguttaceae bacterium]|nr:LUD domain-containing protein [Thermoguttaceae bacterium]MBR5759192.1 LUD domain-containing protein [Thermoguttaceae bacterium]
MDSRTFILDTIRKALSDVDKTKLSEPETPLIWDRQGASKDEMAEAFKNNIKAVAGEAVICADAKTAAEEISRRLIELAEASQKPAPYQLGVYRSELTELVLTDLATNLPDWKLVFAPENPDADPKVYETMTASLTSPFVLLSDTGSCAIEARSAFERFLCYLSPACFVVAKASQLREHLPDAWSEIEAIMKNPTQHGEIAIVTGPSRTADIEKKLVLGVHGPQKLLVFIIND